VEIFNEGTSETPLATARAAMHALLLMEARARSASGRDATGPIRAGSRR
jgi:hypothetical protein